MVTSDNHSVQSVSVPFSFAEDFYGTVTRHIEKFYEGMLAQVEGVRPGLPERFFSAGNQIADANVARR